MGKAKNNDVKKFELTQREFDYLKILTTCLTYNIAKDKIVSGFLYYVCTHRFGYDENVNLAFEIDLEDDKRELSVTNLPD